MQVKRTRRRWQIELRPRDERLIRRLIPALGNTESEAGRKVLEFLEDVIDHIARGYKLVAIPRDDESAADLAPALTRAVRPEIEYDHLVLVPHTWRKQLVLKGRRITAGQLVGQMRANGWDVARASREFDLSEDAVVEAMDYAERFQALIAEEQAEERRRAELGLTHAAPPR